MKMKRQLHAINHTLGRNNAVDFRQEREKKGAYGFLLARAKALCVDRIAIDASPKQCLTLEESEKVLVYLLFVSCAHAVRCAFVDLERRVLYDFG